MIDVRDWHRAFDAANAPISAFEHDDQGLIGIEFNLAGPGRLVQLVRWTETPRSRLNDSLNHFNRYTLTCFCRRTHTLAIHETDTPVSVMRRICTTLVNHGCLKRRPA